MTNVTAKDTQNSQSVENALNMKFLKFHNYLMEGFRVDLKTFLGLAKHTPKVSESKYQASDNFRPKSPNLYDPYSYIVLPYYMIISSLVANSFDNAYIYYLKN